MKKSLLFLSATVFIAMLVIFVAPTAVRAQEEPCQPVRIWAPEFVAVVPQNAQTPTSTPKPTRTPYARPMCTPAPLTATAVHLQPPFTQNVYVPEVRGENQGPDYYWALLGKITATVVGILCVVSLMLIGIVVCHGFHSLNN